MKSKEQIEELVLEKFKHRMYNPFFNVAFVEGYMQCQEDMAKDLEALRAAIRKNTWYDIDGNAQVNLYGIDSNLLNKQD